MLCYSWRLGRSENTVDIDSVMKVARKVENEELNEGTVTDGTASRSTMIDLFLQSSSMSWLVIKSSLVLASCSMVYHAVTLAVGDLPGDLYTNTVLMAGMDLVSHLAQVVTNSLTSLILLKNLRP